MIVDIFDDNPEKNKLISGCVLRDDRGTYDHFGIYAGNKKVIHFTNGKITTTSIKKFTESFFGYIDVMDFERKFTKNISLKESHTRAISRIGMTDYDFIDNNCEHFALWCRTGKAVSTQAFGSKSENYFFTAGAAAGSIISIPRLISNFYSSEVGMSKSRTVDIDKVDD